MSEFSIKTIKELIEAYDVSITTEEDFPGKKQYVFNVEKDDMPSPKLQLRKQFEDVFGTEINVEGPTIGSDSVIINPTLAAFSSTKQFLESLANDREQQHSY